MRNLVPSAVVVAALAFPVFGNRADASVQSQASQSTATALMASPQYVYTQPGGYYPTLYYYPPTYYYGPSYYPGPYVNYYGPRYGGGVYFGFGGGRWGGWRRH